MHVVRSLGCLGLSAAMYFVRGISALGDRGEMKCVRAPVRFFQV